MHMSRSKHTVWQLLLIRTVACYSHEAVQQALQPMEVVWQLTCTAATRFQ